MKVLVAWTLMVAYLGFAAVSAGLQTNWFRYPASVEAWAVLVPLALSTAAVIVFNVFFLRRKTSSHLVLGCVSIGLGVFLTLWMTRVSQGVYFPRWYTADVVSNGAQRLETKNGLLTYYLELRNPFASSHEEHLVFVSDDSERRIKLPVFHTSTHVFAAANEPADWCTLFETSAPHLFVLRVSSYLRESWFDVNLAKATAAEKIRRPKRYLIPTGYTGWVKIHHGVKGSPALVLEGGFYVLKIPSDGKLVTSSELEYGSAMDQYYYHSGPVRQDISEFLTTTGIQIWGKETSPFQDPQPERIYEAFFVGTEEQYRGRIGDRRIFRTPGRTR